MPSLLLPFPSNAERARRRCRDFHQQRLSALSPSRSFDIYHANLRQKKPDIQALQCRELTIRNRINAKIARRQPPDPSSGHWHVTIPTSPQNSLTHRCHAPHDSGEKMEMPGVKSSHIPISMPSTSQNKGKHEVTSDHTCQHAGKKPSNQSTNVQRLTNCHRCYLIPESR